MKKLMCAVAAVAAGACFADGIASANVVGYNSYQCPEDATAYFVGSFDNISKTGKITLGQITPSAEWDHEWMDTISTVNGLGLQTGYYTYIDGDWYVCDVAGNPEGDPVNDTELDLNAGMVVYTAFGAKLTFSGQVVKGDCEMQTAEDATAYTGNFTPAPLKIGDIVPDSKWDHEWMDTLSTVDGLGLQTAYYTYIDGDWYVCDVAGNPSGEPVNTTVVFEANQALVVYTAFGATLNLKSPIQ